MKKVTREVIFINTTPKSERIRVLKSSKYLNDLDDDTNVFCKSIIDHYEHRQQQLANMSCTICCYLSGKNIIPVVMVMMTMIMT